MVTWQEFADSDSELAANGQAQLFQFGVGLAFLATIRKDGAPRLHPVCPVLSDGHLYVLVQPNSPKEQDLVRDGRYALQAFPPPKEKSEEFYVTGRAERVEDSATRARVFRDARHRWREDEVLFELRLERVMYTTWENWGTPNLRPIHRKWHAGRG